MGILKGVFILGLFAVVQQSKGVSSSDPSSVYDCSGNPDGNYNHPRKCSKFISCSNGITNEMDCPANLQYNRDHGDYCDYPELAGCTEIPEETTEIPLNECEASLTPLECIFNPRCAYCLDQNSTARSKCDFLEGSTCSKIYSPTDDEESISIDTEGEDSQTVIGLQPSVKRNFTVNLHLSEVLLDFYYLMDFSGSFSDDKRKLVEKCPDLIAMLQTINSNPALGFGAFVDKPISPLGSYYDYSFQNRLSLTTNTSNYVEIIQSTPVLSGGDVPESILDGIYQAASCIKDIGWRRNSRRFLLATTDAPPHMAGDGAEMFNLTEFDGQCSLNESGHYTNELEYDYPSVEQIKQVVEENEITLTLAATSYDLPTYREIANQIKGAEAIELAYDSGNIIEVIKKAYDDATEFVEIQATGLSDLLKVKYYSTCGGEVEEETSICKLPETGIVSYILEIELLGCPDPSVSLGPIEISPVGVTSHAKVDVVAIC